MNVAWLPANFAGSDTNTVARLFCGDINRTNNCRIARTELIRLEEGYALFREKMLVGG